jgi:uncharacterized Zn-binding protein involved in type VI secretion
MSKLIARNGDQVRGHLDVEGNEVIGNITSGSSDVITEGKQTARTDDTISIPTHPHQLTPTPSDYRSHIWRIVGTGNATVNGKVIAVDGDGGNDTDWDGFQNKPSESYIVPTTIKTNA